MKILFIWIAIWRKVPTVILKSLATRVMVGICDCIHDAHPNRFRDALVSIRGLTCQPAEYKWYLKTKWMRTLHYVDRAKHSLLQINFDLTSNRLIRRILTNLKTQLNAAQRTASVWPEQSRKSMIISFCRRPKLTLPRRCMPVITASPSAETSPQP